MITVQKCISVDNFRIAVPVHRHVQDAIEGDETAMIIMQMIVKIIRVLVVSLSRTAVTVEIQATATTTVLNSRQ